MTPQTDSVTPPSKAGWYWVRKGRGAPWGTVEVKEGGEVTISKDDFPWGVDVSEITNWLWGSEIHSPESVVQKAYSIISIDKHGEIQVYSFKSHSLGQETAIMQFREIVWKMYGSLAVNRLEEVMDDAVKAGKFTANGRKVYLTESV